MKCLLHNSYIMDIEAIALTIVGLFCLGLYRVKALTPLDGTYLYIFRTIIMNFYVQQSGKMCEQ